MEAKLNFKYCHFPVRLHEIKSIFFDILEEKAKEVIAKKVAK